MTDEIKAEVTQADIDLAKLWKIDPDQYEGDFVPDLAQHFAERRAEARKELSASRDRASDACATVQRERDEAREALETALRLMHTARHIAIIAHGHWDADEDSKVGKLLLALSGMLPKYRPDIDEIHAFLARYEASK